MKRCLKIVAAVTLCALYISLSACNTSKGFGKDVEAAGAGIKNSADKNGAD